MYSLSHGATSLLMVVFVGPACTCKDGECAAACAPSLRAYRRTCWSLLTRADHRGHQKQFAWAVQREGELTMPLLRGVDHIVVALLLQRQVPAELSDHSVNRTRQLSRGIEGWAGLNAHTQRGRAASRCAASGSATTSLPTTTSTSCCRSSGGRRAPRRRRTTRRRRARRRTRTTATRSSRPRRTGASPSCTAPRTSSSPTPSLLLQGGLRARPLDCNLLTRACRAGQWLEADEWLFRKAQRRPPAY